MMILSVILTLLWVIAVVYGMKNVAIVDILIEVNTFTSPYYVFGISFLQMEQENVEQLTIGFVFINFNVLFVKNIEA